MTCSPPAPRSHSATRTGTTRPRSVRLAADGCGLSRRAGYQAPASACRWPGPDGPDPRVGRGDPADSGVGRGSYRLLGPPFRQGTVRKCPSVRRLVLTCGYGGTVLWTVWLGRSVRAGWRLELGLEMSRAPTASALISTFVWDIPHSLLVLLHDSTGQRWPSSVIAGCRTAQDGSISCREQRQHLDGTRHAG
jgi:hypothetical protein